MHFTPPPSWPQFVQRPDNKGLPMNELMRKFRDEQQVFEYRLAEYTAYVNYINSMTTPVNNPNASVAAGSPTYPAKTIVLTFNTLATALTQLQAAGFNAAATSLGNVADWNSYFSSRFDSAVLDTNAKTVTLSADPTRVGDNAFSLGASKFSGVTQLTSIVDSTRNTITGIGASTFVGCTGLVTVTLPAVSSVGTSAFARCSAITVLDLNAATTIGATAFSGSTFANLPNLTSSFANVAIIGAGAFTGSTSLKSIAFPTVNTLGDFAFGTCTSLATMSFSSNLSTVGTTPFLNVSASGTGSFFRGLATGSGAPASASIEYLKVTKLWRINLDR